PGLREERLPDVLAKMGVAHTRAARVRKDPFALLCVPLANLRLEIDRLDLRTERGQQCRARLHIAVVVVLASLDGAPLVGHRPLTVNPPALPVDVRLLERRRFAPAEPRQRARHDEDVPTWK